jgi:hypothetical protein
MMLPGFPDTSEVVQFIGDRGVIVGSFPKKGIAAKDLDIVVKDKENERGRNVVLEEVIKRWPDHFRSGVIGHVVITAHPLDVELFDGPLPIKKGQAVKQHTWRQAKRKAKPIDVFGVQALAVVE